MNFNKILVGVDDSADALKAFDYAISFAKQNSAELDIISVLEEHDINVYESLDKDFIHGKYRDLAKHLTKYQHQAQAAGVKEVKTFTAKGNPGETIVKQIIPQLQPDLLIIGSLAKKGLARHLGSQAAYMAKYAPISVWVIR
ncbi:universal stress protein [Ligilactobacillus agilis]|uniref:universal stress protein n=1 Tax=Ligilactobacillus agilis TaxID=1601 RepID=UPI001F57681F|nr:universal stress protein [Ligilactobacillus agilis]UNL42029.1 universal stress protein [Ligilactobacillus agilis]UNL57354.1 universal stress protein [Ligilactobacillus agilis]